MYPKNLVQGSKEQIERKLKDKSDPPELTKERMENLLRGKK